MLGKNAQKNDVQIRDHVSPTPRTSNSNSKETLRQALRQSPILIAKIILDILG